MLRRRAARSATSFPARVSFLLAMRYYAGNWAYSVWLFRGDSYRKLDRLTKSRAVDLRPARRASTTDATSVGLVGKVMAFRLMHLHGRALPALVPKAVERRSTTTSSSTARSSPASCSAGTSATGTCTASSSLRAVQEQCGFEPGRAALHLRRVRSRSAADAWHYRIHDANTGLIEAGELDVRELRARQPWAGA